jgi:hypothetical protein
MPLLGALAALAALAAMAKMAAVAAPAALPAVGANSAAALDWRAPWSEPQDAAAAANHSDEYAWRLFVALNWPASPVTRTADRTARFGADRPGVWESWQSAGDVYLEDGRDPGPWAPADPAHPAAPERRFETLSLQDLLKARHIVDGVMVPLADPIAAAKRLTEIRMNRRTYEFIRARELYNLDGQIRASKENRTVSFPYGAKEVKAKWRRISESESSRYHTTRVTLADGTQRLYGLTGLHIVSKDLPHWFWATFEQVDNPALPDSEGWQLPSKDRFSCPEAAADCNRAPRNIGLEGTVWQYYRLRGTLTEYVDAKGRPELLANSELETGLQKTASCITCHSRASIGVVAGAPARLPIFDPSPDGAPADARQRRGFSGLPRAEWYQEVGADGQIKQIFRPLDFVWSLSQAKPLKGSAHIDHDTLGRLQ